MVRLFTTFLLLWLNNWLLCLLLLHGKVKEGEGVGEGDLLWQMTHLCTMPHLSLLLLRIKFLLLYLLCLCCTMASYTTICLLICSTRLLHFHPLLLNLPPLLHHLCHTILFYLPIQHGS
jgi:hypothetical protein